jgi:hypothetical protein
MMMKNKCHHHHLQIKKKLTTTEIKSSIHPSSSAGIALYFLFLERIVLPKRIKVHIYRSYTKKTYNACQVHRICTSITLTTAVAAAGGGGYGIVIACDTNAMSTSHTTHSNHQQ